MTDRIEIEELEIRGLIGRDGQSLTDEMLEIRHALLEIAKGLQEIALQMEKNRNAK